MTNTTTGLPRVAIVYPIPFGDEGIFGGGERYALELAKALAKRTPTRFITFSSRPRRETIDGLEIQVYRPLKYMRDQKTNPLSLGFLRGLFDVDVVHCVFWNSLMIDFANIFAQVTGKKIFVTDVGGGGNITLLNWLPLAKWVDGYLLIAEQGGKQFESFRSKWHIIYAGINTERYQPDPVAKREGIGFVGRLLPHKGVNYLIEAIDADMPLTIVGRPYHEEYFQLLKQLSVGKKVTFITDASDEDVVKCYQTSAVNVFSSVNDTIYGDHTDLPELLGFTAMEAMACGTPVIVTNVGGMSEVVVDGVTGYLVPPNDPAAIRAKLRLLIENPSLARQLGEAARHRILERFTWDRVAERCLDAYSQ
jgi:glycosyltransferase involved in cell wall biosynthesis